MRGLQGRVGDWIYTVFGPRVLADRTERATRLLEEALELAQAEGVSHDTVRALVERVNSRPIGLPSIEGAQVGVTLLGWASGARYDLQGLVEREIARIERPEEMEAIRRKQAEKARAGVGISPTDLRAGGEG